MRYFLLVVLIAITPTSAIANDYGVLINVGQPGFYGQINLGNNYPRSQLIYSESFSVREARANIWQQHCHRNQTCTQSENFYNDVYVPNHNSDNRYILAQNSYYESNRQHYDGYQDRGYDSHRGYDDYGQERRRDNGQRKQGYDNNRGKYGKDRHGQKNRDRDRRRN